MALRGLARRCSGSAVAYRFRADGHPCTAHEGVTAARALSVAHEIVGRCRSLGVLTTHSGASAAGLTSRVVTARFDARDALGRGDLACPSFVTNPSTRKAQELAADGRVTLTFFDAATEGFVVLQATATPAADLEATWGRRFPTPADVERVGAVFPGGALGGNFGAFDMAVERIEMIHHDRLGDGQRGERVIADHPLGWRPLALVRSEGVGAGSGGVEGGVCCGWVLEADDGGVMIK